MNARSLIILIKQNIHKIINMDIEFIEIYPLQNLNKLHCKAISNILKTVFRIFLQLVRYHIYLTTVLRDLSV